MIVNYDQDQNPENYLKTSAKAIDLVSACSADFIRTLANTALRGTEGDDNGETLVTTECIEMCIEGNINSYAFLQDAINCFLEKRQATSDSASRSDTQRQSKPAMLTKKENKMKKNIKEGGNGKSGKRSDTKKVKKPKLNGAKALARELSKTGTILEDEVIIEAALNIVADKENENVNTNNAVGFEIDDDDYD